MEPTIVDRIADERMSEIESTLSPTNWGQDESLYERADDVNCNGTDGCRIKLG